MSKFDSNDQKLRIFRIVKSTKKAFRPKAMTASAHAEFNEFIKMSKVKGQKYLDQIMETFEVADIDNLVLNEFGSGVEEHFSEYFEFRAAIGAGGFGFVIAALDKETGEEIAIKMLRRDKAPDIVIDLFKKEAEILQSFHENSVLNHSKSNDSRSSSRIYAPPENIIEFRFFREYSNYFCLGMELCIGGNLTEWIDDQRKIKGKTQKDHEED